ncbi:MAG: cation diffusion facilitator family transporter [Elusimicrobiota bacterium]
MVQRPGPPPPTPEELAGKQRARTLVLQSIAMAFGLAAVKIMAGVMAGSLALLASALDSLMDLLSSSVNYVTLRFSQEPADDDHLYGHGKAEAVAGTLQGGVIGLSGLALLVESIRRIVANRPVEAGYFAIGVMVLSMALSAFHGLRLRRAALERNSPILHAEGLHFSMDVLANLGVLVALILIFFGASPVWDVVISLIVAGYVVKEAVTLMVSSINQLLDRRLSDQDHREIRRLIFGHDPRIVGYHDLRSRQSGDRVFIDFHVEIAGVDSFKESHDIAESLVDKIKERLPNADVTVHADPEGEY